MATSGEIIIAIAEFLWASPTRVSIRHWAMLPQIRKVSRQDVSEYLRGVGKPMFVGIMAEPGHLVVIAESDLPRDDQQVFSSHLRNQRAYFREKYASFPESTRSGHVRLQLLEFDQLISVEELERFVSDCNVPAPWTLHLERTEIQFVVRRPDKVWSGGMGRRQDRTT